MTAPQQGQLRRQPRGRRVGPGAGVGVRRAGGVAPGVQLASRRQPCRRAVRRERGGDRGDRHPTADAPPPRTRGDARGDLDDRRGPTPHWCNGSRTRRGWRVPISRERCRPPSRTRPRRWWARWTDRTAPCIRVAAYDYGMKRNILRRLAATGCETTVFPAETPAAEIAAGGFDGVFLSNGPGDPAVTPTASPPSGASSARCRSSGSASAINCSRWPSVEGRSRCGSAIAV